MTKAKIAGLGMHVPEQVVTNEQLAPRLGTTPEWISNRTGIQERRYAPEGVSTTDLALPAVLEALDKARVAKTDIDMIIFATLSPDHHFPGSGCYLQEKLGLAGTPALDIRNQCSGFLYGLQIGDAMIRSGSAKTILLVGAEVHSHAIDLSPQGRDVAALFGDGAGAAVLRASSESEEAGIHSIHLHADGRFANVLCQKIWDIRKLPYIQHEGTIGQCVPEHLWATMKGQEVFRWAIVRLTETLKEACEHNSITPEDIDLLVPHQANMRINEEVAKLVKISTEKVIHSIQKFGNTTAASIPMAMCVAAEKGMLKKGTQVMLAAFGSGFTWGSSFLTY